MGDGSSISIKGTELISSILYLKTLQELIYTNCVICDKHVVLLTSRAASW